MKIKNWKKKSKSREAKLLYYVYALFDASQSDIDFKIPTVNGAVLQHKALLNPRLLFLNRLCGVVTGQ